MINAAGEFSYEMSIDDHTLWVVALDGAEIDPMEVTSAIIHPGETMDVELNADQTTGQFWIRARSLIAGDAPGTNWGDKPQVRLLDPAPEVNAILRYEGSQEGDPSTSTFRCTSTSRCKIFNCPYPAYPRDTYKECIPVANATSPSDIATRNQKEFGLDEPDIAEYFFNFGFQWGSSINANKFTYPPEPFVQNKDVPEELSCSRESCGPDVGCVCTHVVDIPFNKTIQFVFSNLHNLQTTTKLCTSVHT